MAQHILIGSLLCNVLITWAALQESSMPTHGQPLSLPLPQNQNKWIHPVNLEQQPKIQLTWSSYKVTSFLDFQPFLESFLAVYQYLEDFKKDLTNPKYIQRLIYKSTPKQITPLLNETLIHKFFSTEICKFNPFTCTSKPQIEQYKLEIQYIDKVFHATYRKFLTIIDHIDYHPSQVQNTTRTKRSEEYVMHGYYHSYTRTLTLLKRSFQINFNSFTKN